MIATGHAESADWSEAEVGTDHWFRGVGEGVGRGVEPGEVGRLVEIAAILEAQAEVRKQSPVEPSSVDEDRFGGGAGTALAAGRHVEQKTDTSKSEGPQVRDMHGCDPIT